MMSILKKDQTEVKKLKDLNKWGDIPGSVIGSSTT